MHRHDLGGRVVAFELDDHADARAVQVVRQARVLHALEAADRHVLADLAHQREAHGVDRRAFEFEGRQRGDVGRVLLGDQLGQLVGEGDEVVVLGDEIGLAIDFDHRADAIGDVGGDHAFGRDARAGAGRLRAELDAEDLLGLDGIAVGLGEGLLAHHHRRVGLGAQVSHHACGNRGHLQTPSSAPASFPADSEQIASRCEKGAAKPP